MEAGHRPRECVMRPWNNWTPAQRLEHLDTGPSVVPYRPPGRWPRKSVVRPWKNWTPVQRLARLDTRLGGVRVAGTVGIWAMAQAVVLCTEDSWTPTRG